MTNLEWIKERIEAKDYEAYAKWSLEHGYDLHIRFEDIADVDEDLLHIPLELVPLLLQEHVEKPKSVWDLKEGDMCWLLPGDGHPSRYRFTENYGFIIDYRNQGNMFLTKEEALFEKRRREVYTIVKKYAYEFSREEWENRDIHKWFPAYDHMRDMVVYRVNDLWKSSILYFKSEEDIKKTIAEVGEADFIKYYLGVKD